MDKTWLGILLTAVALPAAAQCVKESPPHAVALLELYTSEGCNSCPPADQWLSRLRGDGPGTDSVVPLAFHVDYWDRLGWKDRFASPRFTERQYLLARQAGSRAVYTPGIFLNFAEVRALGRFEEALRGINARPARAHIRLELRPPSASRLPIKADFRAPPGSEAFVALYENRLSTDVKAGENRGVTLRHDYVVREWIGPLDAPGTFQRSVELRPDWKAADMGMAAFVQNGTNVLQASALAACS
ncbi:MAG: DUF1223 domain-containing protein [Betaproteobacteria bacterium]|nr:MAG: DUF1223 domain-containing protein [Betaproteobacteria bacterium]